MYEPSFIQTMMTAAHVMTVDLMVLLALNKNTG
jgi:hypothetical protein